MNTTELATVLDKHKKWLDSDPEGERAVLSRADLIDANLSYANLSRADLIDANLSYANLSYANLSYANLRGADLSGANLSGAEGKRAVLSRADLSGANLSGADLRGADLSGADLRGADLSGADLSGADLSGADLRGADLSGATGLLDAIEWLATNFEATAEGYIAYKTFNSQYKAPGDWQIEPGAVITEVCHSDRTLDCACGINVATLEWVRENNSNNAPVWKVLITWAWLIDAVVPYNTDGKWRTGRAQLIEIVRKDNQ